MEAKEISKEVKKRVVKLGEYNFPPIGELDVPQDISRFTLDQLNELWFRVIAAKAYVDQELGKAESIVIIHKGSRAPRSQHSEKEVIAEATLARIKGVADSLETLITGLSRSITIKTRDFTEAQRDGRKIMRSGFRR